MQAYRRCELLSEQFSGLDKMESFIEGVSREISCHFKEKCLYELFEQSAALHPNLEAVADDYGRYTYRELWELVDEIYWFLKDDVGVQQGDVIAIQLGRTRTAVAFILALLKAHCVYLPLGGRQQHDCKFVDVVVCCPDNIPQSYERARLVLIDEFTMDRIQARRVKPIKDEPRISNIDDLAYIIFTSGSTGEPKGVAVKHRAVINTIEWVNREYQVSSKDRLLCVTPFSFDLSIYDIFGALSVGASVRIASEQEVMSIADVANILISEQVSIWNSAPAYFSKVLEFLSEGTDTSNYLRQIFLSGDWVRPHLVDEIRRKLPFASFAMFGGATEASIWSNYHNIDHRVSYEQFVPYGRPIQNCTYFVLKDDYTLCSTNEIGNLFISGLCLAEGYINDENLTAKKFINLPFKSLLMQRCYDTGDLAQILPTGEVQLIGRRDSQIKVRGIRVELGEIEAILLKSKFIREAICTGDSSVGDETRIVIHIFAPELSDSELLNTVKVLCEEQMPRSMWPSAIRRLVDIRINANGKTDRAASIEYSVPFSISSTPAVSNETEKAIQSLFRKYTGGNSLSLDADFFFSGGNSLTAGLLASSIRNLFPQSELSIAEIYTYRTISEISKIIDIRAVCNVKKVPCVKQVPESIGYISPVELISPQAFHNLVTCEVFLKRGIVDLAKLKRSVLTVYQKHDVFRTIITPGPAVDTEKFLTRGGDNSADLFYEIFTSIDELSSNNVYDDLPKLFSPLNESTPLKLIIIHVAGSDYDRCVFMVHHWIIDGFSMCLLLREISQLYTGSVDCREQNVQASSVFHWNELKRKAYLDNQASENEYWVTVAEKISSPSSHEYICHKAKEVAVIPKAIKEVLPLIAINGVLNPSQIVNYWEFLSKNSISYSSVLELTEIAAQNCISFQDLVITAVTEALGELLQSDIVAINVYQASRYSQQYQLDGGAVMGNAVVKVPFVACRHDGRSFLAQSKFLANEFRKIPESGIVFDQYCINHPQANITERIFLDLNFVPKDLGYERHLLIPGIYWELGGERKGCISNRSKALDDDRRIYVQVNEGDEDVFFHVCINGYYRIDDLRHNSNYVPEVQFAMSQLIIGALMALLERPVQ